MVNTWSRMRLRRTKAVKYYLDDRHYLIEDNEYTKTTFRYDLLDKREKGFFQARLKHNARYEYNIKLDSYLLYYLRFLHWL